MKVFWDRRKIVDKSKMIPENMTNLWYASYKMFTYKYLFFGLFFILFNINSDFFLSHSLINTQNLINVKTILLPYITITHDKGKNVPYLMIWFTYGLFTHLMYWFCLFLNQLHKRWSSPKSSPPLLTTTYDNNQNDCSPLKYQIRPLSVL